MVFSSASFLFLFLPAFLLIDALVPRRWGSYWLLIASYVFYGVWSLPFLGLLIAVTFWGFLIAGHLARVNEARQRRLWTAVGVAGCLAVLGYFKYAGFFLDSIAATLGKSADELAIHWQIVLPVGISFYIFQSISYILDVHRRDVAPARSFVDYAAFIALFPQLIAGPILRYKDMAHQIENRRPTGALFVAGMERFVLGLAKKVLIADSLAPIADHAFATPDPGFLLAWTGALAYAFQLYFDFSGYSGMAIGLGMMMGLRFVENFRQPYLSRSITEFWQRWHISLSIWLRDYLYIPLGGNRRGAWRTYLNLMLVMALGGLWHGANWTFVVWGCAHGTALALERFSGWDRRARRISLCAVPCFLFVVAAWVPFRAPDLATASAYLGAMSGTRSLWEGLDLFQVLYPGAFLILGLAAAIVLVEPMLAARSRSARAPWQPAQQTIVDGDAAVRVSALQQALFATTTLGLAILTILRLAEQGYSPFLYFQF